MLIASIIMFVIALVFALTQKPKTQAQEASKEFQVTTASSGRIVQRVYGTVTLNNANIVWYGDLMTKDVKTKSGK